MMKCLRTLGARHRWSYSVPGVDESEEDGMGLYVAKPLKRKTYQINEFLIVDLEDNGDIVIYVGGIKLTACAPIFIEIDGNLFEGHEIIDSVDQAAEKYTSAQDFKLTPEELFWGHCSV